MSVLGVEVVLSLCAPGAHTRCHHLHRLLQRSWHRLQPPLNLHTLRLYAWRCRVDRSGATWCRRHHFIDTRFILSARASASLCSGEPASEASDVSGYWRWAARWTLRPLPCSDERRKKWCCQFELWWLMTHKYMGCIVVISINKSVEPSEEQKVLTSSFDQGFTEY
jgi:hypothetical protein